MQNKIYFVLLRLLMLHYRILFYLNAIKQRIFT